MFGDVIHNTKEWPIFLLGDLGKTRLGKMLDAKKQIAGNSYPYLANQNVQWFKFDLTEVKTMSFLEKEKPTFLLKKGDLLITEGGDVGRCSIWNDELPECYYQKALHRFRCDQGKIIPEYLAWWFKTRSDDDGFAYVTGAGATIRHLTGDKLKALEVPVPPLSLQKQFQSRLTQIDKLRFKYQRQIELLNELMEKKMDEYFGGEEDA